MQESKKLKIRTNHFGTPWILPGKVYEAELSSDPIHKGCYKFTGELGSPCFTRLEHSVHIGGKDWEIVEIIE